MCVRLCVGTAGLPRKVGLTSLKQYPSQGLLILSLAAGRVNPALTGQCAQEPPAHRPAGVEAMPGCPSSPRVPQRSGLQASTLRRRRSALQLISKTLSRTTQE